MSAGIQPLSDHELDKGLRKWIDSWLENKLALVGKIHNCLSVEINHALVCYVRPVHFCNVFLIPCATNTENRPAWTAGNDLFEHSSNCAVTTNYLYKVNRLKCDW